MMKCTSCLCLVVTKAQYVGVCVVWLSLVFGKSAALFFGAGNVAGLCVVTTTGFRCCFATVLLQRSWVAVLSGA
jgi:hypothetical protein